MYVKIETITIYAVISHFEVSKCDSPFISQGETGLCTLLLAFFSGIISIIATLLIYTENSHWIDCVDNVMCSLSDRTAPTCRSSLNMLHEVFYCKADIVKAMCLYLLGGLQGQCMIVSLN